MPTADQLLEKYRAAQSGRLVIENEEDDGEDDDVLAINAAVETVMVVSDLHSHLLPNGEVEYGYACTVIGSKHFGNTLHFLLITRFDSDSELSKGTSVPAVFYARYLCRRSGFRTGARFELV